MTSGSRPRTTPSGTGSSIPRPIDRTRRSTGCPSCSPTGSRGAHLVANPGCYPTSMILGLAPLLAAGLVEPGRVRVDGKTGLSGAGRRRPTRRSTTRPRRACGPTACPAISTPRRWSAVSQLATGLSMSVVFVPHLVPTVRGRGHDQLRDARDRRHDRVDDRGASRRVRRQPVRAGGAGRHDGRFQANARAPT